MWAAANIAMWSNAANIANIAANIAMVSNAAKTLKFLLLIRSVC